MLGEKIIEWGVYILLFSVPLLFSSYSYSTYELPKLTLIRIFTLFFLFALLIKSLNKKIKLRLPFLDLPVFFFLLINIFATIFSMYPSISMVGSYPNGRGLQDIFIFTLLYFLIKNISFLNIRNMSAAIFFSSFLCSLVGIYQYFVIKDRVYSTLADPNYFGSYIAVSFPFCITYMLSISSLVLKIFAIFSVILIFISFLLCFSRAALIAFFISISLYFFLYFRSRIKWIFLASLFFLLSLSVIFGKEKILRTESIVIRTIMWRDTLYIIRDNWLIGTGVNTYGYVFRSYLSEEYSKKESTDVVPDVPHNSFLESASTTGFIGLFSFLLLTIYSILKSAYIFSISLEKLTSLSVLTSYVAYFVNNLLGFSHTTTLLYFFVFLGVINTIGKQKYHSYNTITSGRLKNILIALIILLFLTGIGFVIKPLISDVLFKKGVELAKEEKIEEAIDICKMAISYNRKEDEYYALLADLYLEFAKKTNDKNSARYAFKETVKNIEYALKISPDDPLYFYVLGRCYFVWGRKLEKDKLKDAEYFFGIARMSDPYNPFLLYDSGVLSMYKGDMDDAIVFFQKAIELEPKYSDAYLGLANVFYNQGNFKEAEDTVKKAIKANPDEVNSYYFLGNLYLKINKPYLAREQFKKVIEKDKTGKLSTKAQERLKGLKLQ